MGANRVKSLDELQKLIQQFHSVEELEKAIQEIRTSPEVSLSDKRLRRGKWGNLFKVTSEELSPLVHWMKSNAPDCKGRIIVGNQNYDAEICCPGEEQIQRLEIGFLAEGHQRNLWLSHLTEEGLACPTATYKKQQHGKSKRAVVIEDPVFFWRTRRPAKYCDRLTRSRQRRLKKITIKKMLLVLFVPQETELSERALNSVRIEAGKIFRSKIWPVQRVDLILQMNGQLLKYHPPSA